MQVYTKILIGMALGAIAGLLLGPNSFVLPQDLYKVSDGASVEVRLDRTDAGSTVALPKGIPLRLHIDETVEEQMTDNKGDAHSIPVWSKVGFKWTNRLGLKASDAVKAALGNPRPGDKVTAWLKLTQTPLESGGFAVSPTPISDFGDGFIAAVRPLGQIFMRLLKMVIVPLVFSSLLVGVASLGDIRKLGRLGTRTLGLYMCTTAVAVSIGLFLANAIGPGEFVGEADKIALGAQFAGAAGAKVSAAADAPSFLENVMGIIPSNPIASLVNGEMLQIIFFAVIFGVALTLVGAEKTQGVVDFFDRIQDAMIVIIQLVMAIAPFGVFALIAEVIGSSGLSVLGALVVYAVTVVIGLLVQAILVYGGLVRALARLKLLPFLKAARPAQLMAFGTSSSSATLPVSMQCAEENMGVSNSVSSFVLPLGSTVNMDGTALYQGVAAIFIAQVFGIDLSFGDQAAIVFSATMASVGAAGVPGAGIVTLAMVLTTVGIPTAGVALVLGMDRLLDMFRTSVNVTGDLAVTAVMARLEGENLALDPDGFDEAATHTQDDVSHLESEDGGDDAEANAVVAADDHPEKDA
jgi:Na+/H+-dicarboxylate symporter